MLVALDDEVIELAFDRDVSDRGLELLARLLVEYRDSLGEGRRTGLGALTVKSWRRLLVNVALLRLIKCESQHSRTYVVHITLRQEEFSRAYVRAVAAVAGYATSVPTPDNQSVDLNLRKNSSDDEQDDVIVDPQLDLQLKCTGQDIVHNDALHLPLKLKNYDDLRRRRVGVRRILVVHLIPPDIEKWLSHAEEDYMALRHCSYWVSLQGRPALPPGQESVTVRIPRVNRFTAEALSEIMDRIKRGEPL